VRDGGQAGIDPPGVTVAPRAIPLNEAVAPLPSRRMIRLFGRRLPGAMLLAAVTLAAVVALVLVAAALVI